MKSHAALEKGDANTFGRLAHNLKGVALNFSAEPIANIALKLEELGKREDLTDAPALLSQLNAEILQGGRISFHSYPLERKSAMTRVLFIDDEPINYQLVARALEPLKCELHYSENGRDGVAKARSLNPDIIITDVMMPDINGYEVTRILRREIQFSSTPILVLTAQSGLQDKLKSFEAGADDHLTKPFEAVELAARVIVTAQACGGR